MSSHPNAPAPGTVLAGKYLVENVLGVGGMGVVVAARHLHLDQRVAIKYLLPAALENPELVERFAREARASAKIRGEHVARVIDVAHFDDGAPFMVLEYLDGHDLSKELEKGPLAVEDAVRHLLQACEALAEAHAAKIVHRDLKPSNLFLARQPDGSVIVKVLDFGISKMGDTPSAALTRTASLVGTVFYMSPEQLRNPKSVDHRSDIWTLGVILYELLVGRPPFLGETMPEVLGGIMHNEPEPIRKLRPDLPPGLEAVVERCMQTNTVDRFQSVAALAAALGAFALPEDRVSVEISARVLGEVPQSGFAQSASRRADMSPVGAEAAMAPDVRATARSAATAILEPAGTGNVSASAHSVPVPGTAGGAPPTTPSAGMPSRVTGPAMTTTAGANSEVATSAAGGAPSKRSPTMLAIAAIGALAVGGGAVVWMSLLRPSAAPANATGMVEAPSTPSAATSAMPSAAASNAATGAGLALEAPPVVDAGGGAAPAISAASSPVGDSTAAAPAKTGSSRHGSSQSSAKASPSTTAPAVTAALPTATPAASTSKNPLQMGIK